MRLSSTRLTAVAQAVRALISLSNFPRNERRLLYEINDFNRYMKENPDIAVNGDFSNGLTGWMDGSSPGGVITISGNVMSLVNNGGVARVAQQVPFVPGKRYVISWVQTGQAIPFYTSLGTETIGNFGAGNNTYLLSASTATTHFSIRNINESTVSTITNVQIRELSSTVTLFQDNTGISPVIGIEQPVGLLLDKGEGLQRGPELFTGTLPFTTALGGGLKCSILPPKTGKHYEIIYTITASTIPGNAQQTLYFEPSVSGFEYLAVPPTIGTHRRILVAQDTQTGLFSLGGTGPFTGQVTFSSLSVREVLGSHAFQVTAPDRPILSNRYNQLTRTENFSASEWLKTNTTVLENATLAPNGTLTADKLQETTLTNSQYTVRRSPAAFTTGNYSLSLYVKAEERTVTYIEVGNAFAFFNLATGSLGSTGQFSTGWIFNSATITPANNGFYLCTVNATCTVAATYTPAKIHSIVNNLLGYNGVNGYGIYIWGASLVHTDQLNLPYQSVNTTTDYDSNTDKFPLFLRCNGTNTWMLTNTIDFSSTDKVTIMAGIRKLSDDSVGMIAELGNYSTTNSTFGLASRTEAASYGFRSRGTSYSGTLSTGSPYPAPHSTILTGIGNISGDVAAIRANGVQFSRSDADQGTGNYGTFPLYLFRRGGTSLPFNGFFYSLLIRGNVFSNSQNIHMEKILASGAGISL